MNPQPASTRQVLLGLFIVAQLLFLISTNLIGFLKDNRTEMGQTCQIVDGMAPGWLEEKGHLWHLMEHLAMTDKMWAQVTGQFQSWSLFAPSIARECVFPAVELRWDDEPRSAQALARPLALLAAANSLDAVCLREMTNAVAKACPEPELVLSDNEPVNPEHFFRFGNFRLRRYENILVIVLRPVEDEQPEKTKERWRDAIRGHVTDYAEIIQGYLRWRVGQAMVQWPGRAQPRQVILVMRRYHINDYENAPPFWTGPHVVPLARWQPAAPVDGDHQPLGWYDPVTQRFKSLRK